MRIFLIHIIIFCGIITQSYASDSGIEYQNKEYRGKLVSDKYAKQKTSSLDEESGYVVKDGMVMVEKTRKKNKPKFYKKSRNKFTNENEYGIGNNSPRYFLYAAVVFCIICLLGFLSYKKRVKKKEEKKKGLFG